ncbi:hypothetical protein GARC_1605 [Paraglaciecola arctica BSs20135]|uniref:MSHA biogenesis protein MshI n=2 Tax=Paraglaciecola TaxID=1621534 RepID=K6YK62_9ALTE|nr:hypothetical protein GARC_1605 [Paraglaciecola arctica BSs20135]
MFAVLFCSLLYFYLAAEQQNIQSKIAKIEQNKQQQGVLLEELQNAVDSLEVDPELLKQAETIQQRISLKKRVLNEVVGQEQLKANGYSNLMIDLASHNQNGLWLTHINLNGISVIIEGAATDSSLIPKWLSSLGQTDYFSGQEFADTRLYRDSEQQLNFVISTGKELKIEKDSNNE